MVSKRRQRELARMRHQRRQQQLVERRTRQRRRNAVIASVLAVLLVLGLGSWGLALALGSNSSSKAKSAPTPLPTASTATSPAACAYTKSGAAAKGKDVGTPSTSTLDKTHNYLADMKTNRGTVTFQMFGPKAPCTVNSFRFLASKHFFDNTPCHRLTSGGLSVLQCGDPTGSGSGGPGYKFPDENLTGATYTAGTIAMANSGPNTNGSQFFLVYKDSQLGPQYTPFGKVVSGLGVLTAIAAKGSDPAGDGKPKEPVTIESFTVKAA
ncbi:MAG: peptidylprolyl isomerase [Actinomycetes bacterium]